METTAERKWTRCGCPVRIAPDGSRIVTHRNVCNEVYASRFSVDADAEITAGADKEEPTTMSKTEPQKEMSTPEKPKRFYKVLELEVFSSDTPSIGINVDPWQDNGAGVSITLTLFIVCVCLNLGFWFTDESETQPSIDVTPDVKEGTEEKHA